MTEPDRTKDIALAEYTEVLTQFRTLTDIRFKLLTYLPLGTVAAAVFVPEKNNLVNQPAIAVFAFVVTLCIATYDKRNDQHYDELVSRAAELERELQIEHGSFSDRPKSWLKYFGFVKIEHRWPIGVIYAASASLWVYLFTAALVKEHCWPIWLEYAAPAVVIPCWLGLHWMENARSAKQREVVKSLMDELLIYSAPQDKVVEKIAAQSILGVNKKTAERRVNYYWKEYEKKRDTRAASALLAGVIDLPARWIGDVYTGRR